MRGLWLSYPDGSGITARETVPAASIPGPLLPMPETSETTPAVVDPAIRRGTLEASAETAGGPPLVRGHAPLSGVRPSGQTLRAHRTDCGWIA